MPKRPRDPAFAAPSVAAAPEGLGRTPSSDPLSTFMALRATGASRLESMGLLWATGDAEGRALAVELGLCWLEGKESGGTPEARANRTKATILAFRGLDPAFMDEVLRGWDQLFVDGDLDFEGEGSLRHLPAGLRVHGECQLAGTGLERLPEGFLAAFSLKLEGCADLVELADDLETFEGALALSGCVSLRRLPDGFQVADWLDLSGCTALTRLPEGLRVGEAEDRIEGHLWLRGCSALERLPGGLVVGGCIDLRGCAAWDGIIPPDARIGGRIITDAYPGKTTKEEGGITLADWRATHPNDR
jgi:hypothetical protein